MSNGNDEAWMYAVVSADLDIVFGAEAAIVEFEHVLSENGGGESAWQNLLGYVPGVVKQRMRNRDPAPRLLATVRYNYLAIRDHPQLIDQVEEAVCEHVQAASGTHKSYLGSKRGNYAQTRHSIEGGGAGRVTAAAHAFHMHHHGSVTGGGGGGGDARLTILGDPTPGEVDHLDLPSAYACVDTQGHLLIVDVTKGVSRIPLPLKLPISWILRTSQDSNEFMVGGVHECMGVVLGPQLDSAVCVDIHLTHQPRNPHGVSNRFIVWGGGGEDPHPHQAITWTPGSGVSVCTEREAKLVAQQQVGAPQPHGNTVNIGAGVAVSFPTKTTVVTCVSGNFLGFDCATNENDFCRVDVDKKEAWCVGMDTEHAIVCMAPLVKWM